jgi:hypothetical protein
MASPRDLMKLCIEVREFHKEGLHLLMGMPSLAHLELEIGMTIKEKLTVGINGFELLKVFQVGCMLEHPFTSVYEDLPTFTPQPWLKFAPGAVPALRWLHLTLNPMIEVASDFLAELGIENLSDLAHLQVQIICDGVAPSRVEALESTTAKAIKLHPSREAKIRVIRLHESFMHNDDIEWESSVRRKTQKNED